MTETSSPQHSDEPTLVTEEVEVISEIPEPEATDEAAEEEGPSELERLVAGLSGPETLALLGPQIAALGAELESKRARMNELARGLQVQAAEHQAALSRLKREQDKAVERAKGQLLEKLLCILDQFQLSLSAIESTDATGAIVDGVHLIYKQFLTHLSELGLEQYDPTGDPFDPDVHEALTMIPVADPAQGGRVVSVHRPGYRFRDRVLRAAQVVVGKAPAPPPQPDADGGDSAD